MKWFPDTWTALSLTAPSHLAIDHSAIGTDLRMVVMIAPVIREPPHNHFAEWPKRRCAWMGMFDHD